MADLRPYPIAGLARRMFRELETKGAIYDLPRSKFFLGNAAHDYSCRFHGIRASTPFGPAAGPHSQMAQNLVLAWLVGARIVELKTVQVRDDLVIPRPCIDVRTVGFNVEWSQELKLEESLEEYVKGALLVAMLRESGQLPIEPRHTETIWDLSVGYDLAGIRSERVDAFVRGMLDARPMLDRLRRELPSELGSLRDVELPARLASTLTLSTFHGCPPDEIERIVDHLMRTYGLHCVVKLNPTLLGKSEARRLLHDVLGFTDLHVPDAAFDRDTTWEAACGFIERLGRTARSLGVGFGVKLTNTLIVENRGDFLPASEREMYLSGPPLHVLAMNLVLRLRETFGARLPLSFSAGIDRVNFPDAAALGLVPITVCTDLLKPGGYGRASAYWNALSARLDAAGASSLESLVAPPAAGASADARDAGLLGATRAYVDRLSLEPRYARAANSKPPKKIGRSLVLLDCITCDKCVPVCPNDAIFTLALPLGSIEGGRLARHEGRWIWEEAPQMTIGEQHQIAIYADFCNECGNCDVFCPEDGGPFRRKARFFGDRSSFDATSPEDAFFVQRTPAGDSMDARLAGRATRLERRAGESAVEWSGEGFQVRVDPAAPVESIQGVCTEGVSLDLAELRLLLALLEASRRDAPSWIDARFD